MKRKEIIKEYLLNQILNSVNECMWPGAFKNRHEFTEGIKNKTHDELVHTISRMYAFFEDIENDVMRIRELDEEEY